MADALEPVFIDLGVVENKTLNGDEEHLNILNRVQIVKWACLLGNQLCRNLTTQRLKDIDSISPDLKEEIICSGLRGADVDLWTKLYTQSQEGLDISINLGLGCIENKNILDM